MFFGIWKFDVGGSGWMEPSPTQVEDPPVLQMLPAIIAQYPGKVVEMMPQALSNSLWASARLKDVVPEVLEIVPAVVAQIPAKVKDMIPQHLSNCLRACSQLKTDEPKVLESVPAIVGEIPEKMKDMNPQDLSNILETLVDLQESVHAVASLVAPSLGEDFMRSAAGHLNDLFPKLTGKDLYLGVPTVIWACAKLNAHHTNFLASAAKRFRSTKKLSPMSWSYEGSTQKGSSNTFGTSWLRKSQGGTWAMQM